MTEKKEKRPKGSYEDPVGDDDGREVPTGSPKKGGRARGRYLKTHGKDRVDFVPNSQRIGQTMRLRSPIQWFGGKGNMVKKLLKHVPPHREYVEVFGGGASLLFVKTPAKVETYNDINGDLVNFFRVIQREDTFEKFYRLAALTPYSRQVYYEAIESLKTETDPVERAYLFWVVARMSFSGDFGQSISMNVAASARNMAVTTSRFLSVIENLPQVHARLQRVQIENKDWRDLMDMYNGRDTFFYLDPPYIHSTRSGGEYKHEMTDEDHRELIEKIIEFPAKIMLSGYAHEIYEPLEAAGWKRVDYRMVCYAAGRTKSSKLRGKGAAIKHAARTESIWMNYEKGGRKGLLF